MRSAAGHASRAFVATQGHSRLRLGRSFPWACGERFELPFLALLPVGLLLWFGLARRAWTGRFLCDWVGGFGLTLQILAVWAWTFLHAFACLAWSAGCEALIRLGIFSPEEMGCFDRWHWWSRWHLAMQCAYRLASRQCLAMVWDSSPISNA